MQTVITITAKDHLERANIARQIRAIAARLPDRIEEDPPGTFRFTDYAPAGEATQPMTVKNSFFRNIRGIKIKNVNDI
jgi:hypothetical protein